MDYRIEGKLCMVAAGAHGIGEATADLLTQEGARVIVADVDQTTLREKTNRWAGVFAADLGTAQGVADAAGYVLDSFGRAPDILVNNLGVANAATFGELSDERWASSLEINLMGCVRACRALLPRMAELGSAAVVNTVSDLAKQPEPSLMDYGACKAALLYVTKALSKEYAGRVRINSVAPGPVWSRMWSRPGGIADQLAGHYGLDREAAVNRFLEDRQMPLGMGQPEDVAHAIVFLASPLAKFINGANLDIGGTLRGLV